MAFARLRVSPLRARKLLMEEKQQAEEKIYHHYQHIDTCNISRWTAKECFDYMYARPWDRVNQFYSELVNGRSSLSRLFGTVERLGHDTGDFEGRCDEYKLTPEQTKDLQGKWARVTFKIVISYLGKSFDGWQKQPGLDTVQGLIESSIGRFTDDYKAEQLKDKGLPVEGLASVAGRTDKGVTALNQNRNCVLLAAHLSPILVMKASRSPFSTDTWRKDIEACEVENAINTAAPGRIRAVSVLRVSRVFHPNFCAKWRRYFYIFPLSEGEKGTESKKVEEEGQTQFVSNSEGDWLSNQHKHFLDENSGEFVKLKDELESKNKPTTFSTIRVNRLLQELEGKLLSYKMFARDTKASRNDGPPTECFIYHARAAEASLPCLDDKGATKIMCIELVANRFLRKMVRVLVATAIREAAAGAEENVLIQLMDATCRRATAPPAPPEGLCLVDVGYHDFDPQICLIH